VDDDPQAAEKALRRALQLDPNYNAARLILAKLLLDKFKSSPGGEAEWNEALSLVSGSLTDPREERLRQTLQALLYATRGGKKNLEQARAIVEKLVSDPKQASAEETLLLARIYELEGKVEEAKTRLQTLVEASPNPPAGQVVAYVELLLRQEPPQDEELRKTFLAETERWVKKLQTLAPDKPQSIALMARWLKNRDRSAEIEPLIEAWAAKQHSLVPKNPQSEMNFLDLLGGLYMSLEAYPAAERWYRKAVEQAADHYPLLARSLARQGRYEEALQLCQNAAEKDPSPLPVITAASLLLEGRPATKDFEQAEKLLGKAAENFRDRPDVLNSLAAVLILQGRMEDATTLYRRVLELQPREMLAMNNLATILAEQPDKLSEAEKLIEQAIALAGPQAGYLDVKGVILIAENKSAQAVPVLEEASSSSQADPRFVFHLAAAYLRARKPEKAREAFERARTLKLDQKILTPGDIKLQAELEQALNKNSPPK
jgi:Flp pilus assembly protein TadD